MQIYIVHFREAMTVVHSFLFIIIFYSVFAPWFQMKFLEAVHSLSILLSSIANIDQLIEYFHCAR